MRQHREPASTDPRRILISARSILLVDWPQPGHPRALLLAGFSVFGFSPAGYSAAKIVAEAPAQIEGSVFPPARGETGFLIFRKLDEPPTHVDIVNVYRPAAELPGIVQQHAVPLGAKTLWLQPPITSVEGRRLAAEHGMQFVEGVDIAAVTRDLGGPADE
jgi:predicted CoA-binding protein